MITRIPNFFTRKALLSGSEILSVAGAHGVGTYAIKNFLSHEKVMKEAFQCIKQKSYFQILIPIVEVEHNLIETEMGKTQLSIAKELGTPHVRIINIDAEKLLRQI